MLTIATEIILAISETLNTDVLRILSNKRMFLWEIKMLKTLFCDKGNHWYKDVITPEDGAFRQCRICGDSVEFTRIQYWALRRGLPSTPSVGYRFRQWVGSGLVSIV